MQDEARLRAKEWPGIRERLLTPPDLSVIEATSDTETRVAMLIGVWREGVARKLGLIRSEGEAVDLSRPRDINLEVLAEFEADWKARTEKLAAVQSATTATAVPMNVSAAAALLTSALQRSKSLQGHDTQALTTLMTALDERVPELVDAHVRQSGRSTIGLTREHPTTRETLKRYLKDYRGRIGLVEQGISAETYNATSKRLHHGLGLSAGQETTFTHAPPIDLDADLHTVGNTELQALVRFWLDGKVKRRTALNRLRAIAAMLDWASADDKIEYQWTTRSRNLFKFSSRKGAARRDARIDPYHKDTLVKLLKAARPRTRLYILLSLNCGMLPGDIAKLRPEALRILEDERTYLVRLRSKDETSDDAYETAHVLWPETLTLLQAERARENSHGRLLLTQAGTPLEVAEVDQWNKNPISKAFDRAVKKAELRGDPHRPQLRQLRKMGASAVFRHADERAAAMYRGQAFEGSASLYITISDWSPLTRALDLWAIELRIHAVLA